ncbi:hypothetical protein PTTG_03738 [Puccinia triticina 1-1 BBBD Race 1]|uniref:Uncharacterized protein n=1 Tax=Puccinia triticina (isolate 1-1 / race 1 (BBBD)) TaxID=630390 RepID=A0A180GGC1_PUCT1|nr:hypothetical protein PTTG_03738 [Puccinia triticina 1-1 BBBD Race 1]
MPCSRSGASPPQPHPIPPPHPRTLANPPRPPRPPQHPTSDSRCGCQSTQPIPSSKLSDTEKICAPPPHRTDTQKIGVGITSAGVMFLMLGSMLFFDGPLLALGNVSILHLRLDFSPLIHLHPRPQAHKLD